VHNCTRDEGEPFGFGDQEPISSHRIVGRHAGLAEQAHDERTTKAMSERIKLAQA
jgi:hypothetical protein